MDINKVWLSGLVVTQPILTRLSSKTPFASFALQINERFLDKTGNAKVRPNIVKIESLGKSADTTAAKVRQGQRFMVDGYLRQDAYEGTDEIKVRSFAVYREESPDSFVHNEGLKQALEIVKKSRDIDSAVQTLEDLVSYR